MKKLTAISILLVLLSVSAFAQLKVGFSSRFVTDAVFFEQATGTDADDEPDKAEGAFNLFSTSGLIGNQLRLDFTYTADHFEGYLQVKGDSLVTRGSKFFGSGASFADIMQTAFGDYYVKGNGWVFTGYAGNTDQRGKVGTTYEFDKFTDFIDNKLNHLGVIKPWNGEGTGTNYAIQYWFTGRLNSLHNAIDYSYSFEPSGTLVTYKDLRGMVGSNTDTDNLKMADSPYISLGIDLSALSIPIGIEVASNATFAGWYNNDKSVGYEGTTVTDKNGLEYDTTLGAYTASASSVYGTFRVSGGKFIDMISFDAIYRINGDDPNTREQNNADVTSWASPYRKYPSNVYDLVDPLETDPLKQKRFKPLQGGKWNNEIGLYAGIDLFKGLSLAAGYTAAFVVNEMGRQVDSTETPINQANGDIKQPTVEFVNPVYNGISLNVNLGLIPNLDLTLNNNVSFAWMTGSDSNTKVIRTSVPYSLLGGALGDKQKDSWFALWNTLGAKYNITERASVSAEISNNLSIYDWSNDLDGDNEWYYKIVTDNIQFGVSGNYAFSSNVSFGAGLNASIWGMEITGKTSLLDYKIGEVRLAMPILFTVKF